MNDINRMTCNAKSSKLTLAGSNLHCVLPNSHQSMASCTNAAQLPHN
jgi:hypothetical protein